MDREVDRLDVGSSPFDRRWHPRGRLSLKVMFGSRYSFWRETRGYRQRYEDEEGAGCRYRHLPARSVSRYLRPGRDDRCCEHLTTERYTGNWQGLPPWMPSGAGLTAMTQGFTRTLPGLQSFHMAGHWAEAMFGVSTAAISGKRPVQRICKGRREEVGAVED